MLSDLLNISGMEYRQFCYTAKYWQNKTGVNVTSLIDLVKINKNGLCGLTEKAIKLLENVAIQNKLNSKIINHY